MRINENKFMDSIIQYLILLIMILIVSWGFNKYQNRHKPEELKLVQVDLVKISSDYMQKAVLLVASANQNNNLTQDQKMEKAQNIMKVVGMSIDSIINEYSTTNKVVVLQKQMIASDAGRPLYDITNEVESQIDTRINPSDLHDAVSR